MGGIITPDAHRSLYFIEASLLSASLDALSSLSLHPTHCRKLCPVFIRWKKECLKKNLSKKHASNIEESIRTFIYKINRNLKHKKWLNMTVK